MRKRVAGSLIAAAICMTGIAHAGPWEDGMAKAGNAKAQMMLGSMYQRGQGVAKSSSRAFMWFSLAASRGDTKAKVELKAVEATMTADDLSQARAMMQACEASDYRNCEY